MNNIQVDVGRFCATLRRKLFQEHLGLLNEPCANVLDPVSDEFFKVTLLHYLLVVKIIDEVVCNI